MRQAGRDDVPHTIDLHFLDQPGVIASYLLRADDDVALVDVGPASSQTTLLSALHDAGIAPEQVRHVLLTHIHLDHAGAAGVLMQHLPNARVYVHEVGAPHLIDPSRLISSASRVYGSLMKRLWGAMLPVPADRVVVLHDGQILEVAGRRLQVLYAPGHAIHHVVYRDLDAGSMYTGDVAGVRMPGCAYVRPPTPPPDLDLDAWEATIDRLASLHPTAFYVTHFGRATGTQEHLDQLRRRLRTWEQLVLEHMQAGEDRAAITLALQRASDLELSQLVIPDKAGQYETAGSSAMNVSGFERYLRKRHPELVPLPSSL
jgi:glyoxylase-like metal-dependent hydrolase (beta-lactamase superfamily II)